MNDQTRCIYLAMAKIRLSHEPATDGVMHAITLIETAMPPSGDGMRAAAFASAHDRLRPIAEREGWTA